MEILRMMEELRVAENIKKAIDDNRLVPNSKNLIAVKKELKESCNLIFINIISSTDSDIKLIAKTKSFSYTYNYNKISKKIRLIGGIRKNVIIS